MTDVVVIAGPNGAGKSTTAARLLPRDLRIFEFVNADEIARGISPYNPDGNAFAAGRVMLARIRELADMGESFAFETTLSGLGYVRYLKQCRAQGYRLTLLFLWLPSVRDAIQRVKRRVAAGGHSIPEDVIRRRYAAGIRNLVQVYLPLVNVGLVYDNSDDSGGELVAEKYNGKPFRANHSERWQAILKAANEATH
ncbi:MAG: hypothetical protein SFV19_16875 [Rhodospirillaceae bacterium]|nr:hypothetical protein [Rhodospirillaceae bacterium]